MKQHTDLYEVSKNYQQLFKLISEGYRVVCFVDYNDKAKFRDVAVYRGVQKYCNTWELTARGISYTQFDPEIDNIEYFIQDCERINLEFFDQSIKLSSKPDWYYTSKNEFPPEHNKDYLTKDEENVYHVASWDAKNKIFHEPYYGQYMTTKLKIVKWKELPE